MPFPIPNAGGATYTEHCTAPSPRIAYTATGPTATRVLDIDYADLLSIRAAILGYPKVGTSIQGGGRQLQRVVPWHFPGELDSGGKPYLFATKVDAIGLNPNGREILNADQSGGQISTFGKARLTVTYEPLTWDILTDVQMFSAGNSYTPSGGNGVFDLTPDEATLTRYVVIRPKPQAEAFGVPAGTFKDVIPTKTIVAVGLNKQLVTWDIEIEWREVPKTCLPCSLLNPNLFGDTGVVETTLGKLNKTAFANCNVGTLLFLSAEMKPIRTALGDRAYNVSYRFKKIQANALDNNGLRNFTFTHLYHKPPGQSLAWYEISSDGTTNIGSNQFADGKSIYDWADFHPLLRAQ